MSPRSGVPDGFTIRPDRTLRSYADGRVLTGGSPFRVLRLGERGADALDRLRRDAVGDPAAGVLARRLLEVGLAHPAPPPSTAADPARTRPTVAVVIPVRDRASELDRCLAALGNRYPVVVVDDASTDPDRIAGVCGRHGARLHRRSICGGPAAARNDGLRLAAGDVVAFLDSDCVPPAGWVEDLLGHFADPVVGAVAPRVAPMDTGAGVLARYAVARSPLDLGPHPASVRPMTAVSYVPTAALLVRRRLLGDGFDERLRYGEDVDLVWRLRAAGHVVRYEPAVVVRHEEPRTWRRLLARRLAYGTSAAPLARRHPGRLAPVVVSPWPAAVLALLLAGFPGAAAAGTVVAAAALRRRLRPVGVPSATSAWLVLASIAQTGLSVGRYLTQLALPLLAVAAVAPGRRRRAALGLLLAPPLVSWVQRRPRLDPVRWLLISVADDASYGAGVWLGAVRDRNISPLRPSVNVFRGSS